MSIELAPHQMEAVERACRALHQHGGVILADDVGLGKSFVAAAVAARTDAAIECIVPAGLAQQWAQTLEAFAVTARVTTHDRIIREPFAPRPDGERLIVVDEAHAFRNPHTQRYGALARRSIGARLLLVTATPICNSPHDLHALITLIAADDALRAGGVASIDDAFRTGQQDALAIIMRVLVIRRGREAIDERFRFGELERIVVRHDVAEVAIGDLQFPLVDAHAELLRALLWRRLESSEAALLESLQRQTRFYQRALQCLATGRTLTKRDYRDAFGDEDADAFQEVLFWEVFAGDEARADAGALRAELSRLDAIRRQLLAAGETDKSALLREHCAAAAEPILVFTAAIATARHIFSIVTRIRNAGVITSRGAVPANAIEAFARGRLDVLVCTDLAAEGLNLQHAGVVMHYDLPWNPVKIDQRNGRALRIGQTRPVVRAIYFLPRGRRTRVVRTIAAKNRSRRALFRFAPPSASSPSILLLPARLPRGSPAVVLAQSLRQHGLRVPAAIGGRYRAGIERLFAEMAEEFLDEGRVADLTSLLERERIIGRGSSDR